MSLNSILRLLRPLILFDLETTGKDPNTARILQLGMRVYRPNGNISDYKTLVNPGVPIPRDASDTHGITQEIIDTGCARCHATADVHPTGACERFRPVPRFSDIATDLAKGFSDADFAGYNIRYDIVVVLSEFDRNNVEVNVESAKVVDALRIWHKLEPRSLTDAVEHFGEEGAKLEGAHDAMNDVVGTEIALVGQLTRHKRSASIPRTVAEIHDLCFPDMIDIEGKFKYIDGVTCFSFGKHRDQPVQNHPDYLRWILRENFSAGTKRWCKRFLSGDIPKQDLLSKERMDG